MKYNIVLLYSILILLSCDNKIEKKNNSPRIKSFTKIVSPVSNSIFRDNDSIVIKVQSRSEKILKSTLVLESDSIIFNDSIKISSNRLTRYGKHRIVIKNELEYKKVESISKVFYKYPLTKPNKTDYKVLKILPHNKDSYTQGLLIHENNLFESSGQYGKSFLRKSSISDNKTLNKIIIDNNYFAEGITIYDNKLYMLTWKSNKGFIYDINSLTQIDEFSYNTEGWGLTSYQNKLLMSDGSEKIYFRDPYNFEILNILEVYDNNGKVENINELEIINDKLFCNIYGEDIILIVNINSGKVEGKLNLENLFNKNNYNDKIDVMNGIAYNRVKNSILVTGKWWPSMYEIEILKK